MRNIAMAFHKWMLKNKWEEHSSREYYFKDNGSWPPAETKTEEELLSEFVDK